MIKTQHTYSLIKKDIPFIKGKRIIEDARVGGEKLVYNRVSCPIRVWNFFNLLNITVPLLFYRKRNGGISTTVKTTKIVYLRPYKKNWSHRKDKLPFHLWGKKEHPLTNLWVELEFDYQDIIKSTPIIKTRVEDPLIIKFLRQHEEKFKIIN